ncbi:hypothetical protein [Pseudomonas sp. 2835]|uniref:hypothetical protein n=1 Tax=Pseudomonas sp. 2835 TaxID=3156451 RepID=UPI003D19E47B
MTHAQNIDMTRAQPSALRVLDDQEVDQVSGGFSVSAGSWTLTGGSYNFGAGAGYRFDLYKGGAHQGSYTLCK